MSSGDQDQTIFKQPKPGGGVDRTMVRGRSGSQGNPPPPPPPEPAAQPYYQTPPQAYAQPQAQPAYQRGPEADYFAVRGSFNPLVGAASTLLAVFEKVKQSMAHGNVGELHKRLVNEIQHFEQRANERGLAREIVISARYLLCSVLDEAVLNTPWGSESAWSQRSLLTVFHNEAFGGEKSFVIIDRMRQRPAENLYFIELSYICLSIGFEGKYRFADRGRDTLEQLRDELFRIIRYQRGDYERGLSPSWQGLGKTRNTLSEYIPIWVLASCVAVVLFFGYSGFKYWLYQSANPVVEKLTQIADIDPTAGQ